MTIDGSVTELPDRRGLVRFIRNKPRLDLASLRNIASELASDTRPGGLLVTLKRFEGGMAAATAVRQILKRLSSAGRPVVVYLPTGVDTRGYFVASGAKQIFGFPAAQIALLGFASRGVFVKGVLSKAGVVAEVLAHGKYKSAGDALTRDEMSEPQREQVGALLDRMYESLTGAISESRGLSASDARGAIDAGIHPMKDALVAKLIDGVVHDDELAGVLAPSAKPPLKSVTGTSYLAARRATGLGKGRRGPYVAVVRVHGAISQGDAPFARGAIERDVVGAVRAAREDRKARGVILHIDSPGGSALASARMHRELELLAAEKPLVACMGDVAASGGYYVAAPAHAIVAQPLTITGSIGVVSVRFSFGPILARLGIRTDVLLRGARADLFDPARPLSAEERNAFEREIESTYREFVAVVARGRAKSHDEVDALAQGRVWSGQDAKDRGLVDALGGFDVALEEVQRRIGARGAGLSPRLVRGQARARTLTARGADPEKALVAHVLETLELSADVLALLAGTERVLAWAPETTGCSAWP